MIGGGGGEGRTRTLVVRLMIRPVGFVSKKLCREK